MKDVWDGSCMAKASEQSNNKKTISVLVSTDGIPLFKSASVTLWPVSFVILKVPPAIRMISENIVLTGFWIGSKPPMKHLFGPIMKSLNSLSSSGLKIKTSTTSCIVFFKLVLATFDLPAKAAVLNAKQFNGKYGSSVCLHPGYRLPNNARIYCPLKYRERIHRDVVRKGETAESEGRAIKGIIGISPLSSVLDLVDAVPVDYMHTVFTRCG